MHRLFALVLLLVHSLVGSLAHEPVVFSSSWRAGCPVPIADLRVLHVPYWGFDDLAHDGTLVVHRDVAAAVVSAFDELYAARFPIRRIVPIDAYGGDDARSTAADNTSAFNCRPATGSTSWSEHAYGRAIDLNPLENPYVTAGGEVLPTNATPFVDRRNVRPGMVEPGGPVIAAFARIGWKWGGDWSTPKDYQHFSVTGH